MIGVNVFHAGHMELGDYHPKNAPSFDRYFLGVNDGDSDQAAMLVQVKKDPVFLLAASVDHGFPELDVKNVRNGINADVDSVRQHDVHGLRVDVSSRVAWHGLISSGSRSPCPFRGYEVLTDFRIRQFLFEEFRQRDSVPTPFFQCVPGPRVFVAWIRA